MAQKSYYTMYRKILRVAWQRTWERKYLWILGFFAAWLSTGGLADITIQHTQHIRNGSRVLRELFTGTFIDLNVLGYYLSQLRHVDPTRLTVTATVLLLLVIAAIVFSVVSQGALVYGLSRRTPAGLKTTIANGFSHFWHVLGLNIVAKLLQVVLLLAIVFPATLVLLRGTLFDTVFYFFISLVFFPAAIIVHIIAMLALMDIVRKNNHMVEAIRRSAHLFKKHWLVTLELGVLLFLIVIGASVTLAAVVIVLAIPYTMVSLLSLFVSPVLVTLWQGVGLLTLFVLLLAFVGATTTFQYACWLRFYERTVHKTTKDRVMAKLERWWRKAWE